MNEIFLNAQRARLGQSSERTIYVIGEDQLCLFNEAKAEQDTKAKKPTKKPFTVQAHVRKKKETMEERMKKFPVEEVLLELLERQRICSKCGSTLKKLARNLPEKK